MSSHRPLLASRAGSSADRTVRSMLHRAAGPVAVLILGAAGLVGCDTPANQEDRKVQADVTSAQRSLSVGDQAANAAARKALEQAAADTSASPLTRVYAKSALAEVEENAAIATMHDIDLSTLQLTGLTWEISQLARQLDASHALAGSYDKFDPKPAQDALAADIAAAQGGPAEPNLAQIKQKISELEGQIAKQRDDLKTLQDKRTQTLDEADQADKSSEISKGQESVDDFKRAADLRRQAGALTVQIDKNQAQTVPLQRDLEVAQGQQAVLQEQIQLLQEKSQQIDAGWKSVQNAVAEQATLQKQIVSGSGDASGQPAGGQSPAAEAPAGQTPAGQTPDAQAAGQSIEAKADALAKLVQQLAQQRSEAASNLNSAIQHYRDAASAAQEYFATLDPKINDPANAQRPEVPGWRALRDLAHPASFHLKEALAQRQLAQLSVSEIYADTVRAQVQDEVSKILGEVNLPIPPGLSDAGIDQEKKSAADAATAAYTAAENTISGMRNSTAPQAVKNAAKLQYVLTLYGEARLAHLNGDASTAQQKLSDATAARDEASSAGLQLPPLPDDLTAPPANPAGAPATPAS